ncbi:MAG: SH3 domain-containing protein [Desulfonatronovibrionaceae bacterium]
MSKGFGGCKESAANIELRPAYLLIWALCFPLAAVFSGCAPEAKQKIHDLEVLPQEIEYYLPRQGAEEVLFSEEESQMRFADFREKWFSPWHASGNMHSRAKVYWGVDMLLKKTFFGENKRARSWEWKQDLIRNSEPDAFPSLDLPGIILRSTALRVLPTQKPAFRDFSRAGEGYPFDYMQNSAIWAGTPVRISHISADGAWLLVETEWVFGWVRRADAALVDKDFIRSFEQSRLAAVIRDRFPVKGVNGEFLFFGRVGMVLPILKNSEGGFFCLAPSAGENGYARMQTVRMAKGEVSLAPLEFTPEKVAVVAGEMLGEPYGWGGMYGNRDCSALMRDIFTPFGVWLPRNSSKQAEAGRIISLEGLGRREKKAVIQEYGVPFATLVHMPGHVGLYLGTYNGEPLLLHNVWGIKTKSAFGREDRHVIGKTVISTLEPGAGLSRVGESGLLINRISGINILN